VREYELIYLIQPDATPERQKEIHSRVDEIVAQQGGMLLLRDDWGKRKLAYEIQKFQKAQYVLLSYLGEGKIVDELERALRLDPDVVRFLTVKVQDEVKDIESRITEARAEEAERAKRREERERLEAERAAVRQAALEAEEAARAAQAPAELAPDEGGEEADEPVPEGLEEESEEPSAPDEDESEPREE
jgi:small subunit ribosomal protein S6